MTCAACIAENASSTVYYNPNGGVYFHADANCPTVKADYLPMTALESTQLSTMPYQALQPCNKCFSDSVTPPYSPSMQVSVSDKSAPATVIETEGKALVFMEKFFSSPYVDNANENPLIQTVQVEETKTGWVLISEATDGSQTILLSFDRQGNVAQYNDSIYLTPAIGESEFARSLTDDILNWDELWPVMDEMLWNVPGITFSADSLCAYAYDAENSAYTFSYNDFERYATIQTDPRIKLLAYGNMQLDDARYGLYLSRGEAIEAARTALTEKLSLSAEQANALIVTQTNFAAGQHNWSWTNQPPAVPYWSVLFSSTEDGTNGDYGALIDADSGAVLDVYDPSTSHGHG